MSCIDLATLGVLSWALLLQVIAGLYRFLGSIQAKVADHPSKTGVYRQWGFLRPFYTTVEQRSDGSHQRVLVDPQRGILRYFKLNFIEREAWPLLLRQLSLLSLGIIALVRFAFGEPILRLF